MGIDLKNLSSASLDELEKLRETIDDRINIIRGRESLKSQKIYSKKKPEEFMTKEELILAERLEKISEKKQLYGSMKDIENMIKEKGGKL